MKGKSFQKLKITGLITLIIPIVFLLLFLFGEIIGGDISGLVHLFQVLPLLIIVFIAWKWPRVGGSILVYLGLVLGLIYALTAHFSVQTIILVELILFLPPVIAGIFFLLSSRSKVQKE